MTKRFFIFLLLVVFTTVNALAQSSIHFQHITINDGLSQGMVYDILQDRQGFMWFATKDGLKAKIGSNIHLSRSVFQPEKEYITTHSF